MTNSDFLEAVDAMSPETFEALREAVEIGKWPDGRPLTEQQREVAMQAVILYSRHQRAGEDEPFTVSPSGEFRDASAHKKAYLEKKRKSAKGA